jgi:hypothetical protein
VEALGQSPLAKRLYHQDLEKGCDSFFLTFWSDDMEPNYSKVGKGSVWICTLTVQTVHSSTPSILNVYPLAVGPQNGNHSKVLKEILGDIPKEKNMYDGNNKKLKKYNCHLLCLIQDQPERRQFSGLLSRGLGCHGRWGYHLKMMEHLARLPACKTCLKRMCEWVLPGTWVPQDCNRCFCWMVVPTSIPVKTLPYYPEDELPQDHTLYAREFSYPSLKKCLNKDTQQTC